MGFLDTIGEGIIDYPFRLWGTVLIVLAIYLLVNPFNQDFNRNDRR